MGTHKCWKRFDDSHIIEAHKQKKQKKPRSGPAKDMAIDDIVEVLDDPEATISDVEIEADNWTDTRKAKRLQQGSHSSWKTWKNGDSFSSLEKSWNFVIFAKYPGKMRQTLEI